MNATPPPVVVGWADARRLPLADASIDAIVCDPPYGLEFMGKEWDAPWKTGNGFRRAANPFDAGRDSPFGRTSRTSPEYFAGRGYQSWCESWAREAYRVLKPGGHLLAFGGTRTVHRLTCGIEDAGFEIRDGIDWIYGSGFPKSLDVSKAIDKAAGAEREATGREPRLVTPRAMAPGGAPRAADPGLRFDAPATDAARRWAGWGTALKPAHEPIVVARKPLAGTVAANVTTWGTGALNIDGCRVGDTPAFTARRGGKSVGGLLNDTDGERITSGGAGRWPSNVVLSHAATPDGQDLCTDGCVPGCPVAELDKQSGTAPGGNRPARRGGLGYGGRATGTDDGETTHYDSGSASRFFPVFRYQAKAPARERPKDADGKGHATVKPLGLIRWLLRLTVPPGGIVLDQFAGSFTAAEAAILEGFAAVCFDNDPTENEHRVRQRLARAHRQRRTDADRANEPPRPRRRTARRPTGQLELFPPAEAS